VYPIWDCNLDKRVGIAGLSPNTVCLTIALESLEVSAGTTRTPSLADQSDMQRRVTCAHPQGSETTPGVGRSMDAGPTLRDRVADCRTTRLWAGRPSHMNEAPCRR